MKGTTFSDAELERWSRLTHAGEAHTYWTRDRFATTIGAHCVVSALSGEALEMRRILRDFLARHEETTSDPLALRAAELLGFNLEPSQPVFPRWPQAGEGGVE